MWSRSAGSKLARTGVLGLLVSLLALTACGTDSAGDVTTTFTPAGPEPSVTVNRGLADRVPERIRASGVLQVKTVLDIPPMAFGANGTATGADIDVVNALAATLGLRAEIGNRAFENLLTEIHDQRGDLAISSITVTPERLRLVDFVSYYRAGKSWVSQTGSGFDPADLCGELIAVLDGSIYARQVKAASAQCLNQGKAAVSIIPVVDSQSTLDMLTNDIADAYLTDSPVADGLIVASAGQLQQVGQTTDIEPLGIALPQGSALAPVIEEAVQSLIDSGAYEQILRRWQIPAGAIARAELFRQAAPAKAEEAR